MKNLDQIIQAMIAFGLLILFFFIFANFIPRSAIKPTVGLILYVVSTILLFRKARHNKYFYAPAGFFAILFVVGTLMAMAKHYA